jgi:hypothetical protein
MAKKAVASLQKGAGRTFTKCIKMVKSERGFQYVQEMVHNTNIKEFFAKK